MTTPAKCPYHADCWLLIVDGWRTDDGGCHAIDTCPRYQKMEAEKAEKEAEPCGQS